MTQLTNLTLAEKVNLIARGHAKMNEDGSFRSWLKMGKDTIGAEWFSARGITEQFDVHYTTFFKQFFKEGTKFYAGTILTEPQIDAFAQALIDRLNGSLSDEKMPEPKQEGIPAMDRPAEPAYVQPAPAPATVPEVVTVTAEKKSASASFNLMLPLDEMVDAAVEKQIEASGVLKNVADRIKEEAQKLRPTLISIGDRKPVQIEGKLHVAFQKALKKSVRYRQIWIAGPAGTGKTTLASQIAKSLDLPYGHISCTAGMSEAHLLGRMNATGNYLSSEFVNIYENGGVFLFDEIDAADANTLLIINSALANGHMSVPNRVEKPFAKRHKDFYCIAAANTWGFGSNEYVGRNIIDAATKDRFVGAEIAVDYDKELEKEISKDFAVVAEKIWKIRENVKTARIRRVVSTRAIINGVIALGDGDNLKEYLADFMLSWTEEERKKAMQGV